MSKKTKAEARAAKAAAALAERKRKERRRNLIMVGVVVVAAIALIVGVGFVINQARDDDPSGRRRTTARTEYGRGHRRPGRAAQHRDLRGLPLPDLRAVRGRDRTRSSPRPQRPATCTSSYRPFNLSPTGSAGLLRAPRQRRSRWCWRSPGAEVAKEFHDLLYDNQPPEDAGPSPDDDWLVDLAVEAGADRGRRSRDGHRERGRRGLGRRRPPTRPTRPGSTSTPTILLDGEVFQDGRLRGARGQAGCGGAVDPWHSVG